MRRNKVLPNSGLLWSLILLPWLLFSQGVNLGVPPIVNFSRQEFKAGTQMWDISQGPDGIMWFANNDGLLEFDGTHWRLYRLDNGTIVRSVRAGADGQVFVGGQGDFGYFEPAGQGRLAYRSLLEKLAPADRNFGDVWDIELIGDEVYFRTNNQVFYWHNQQLTPLFPTGKTLNFMGGWGDQVLIQDNEHLLYIFKNGQAQPLGQPGAFQYGQISALLAISPDTLLITTIKNGIYALAGNNIQPWPTADDAFLRNNRIFCAITLPNGSIALGTSFTGLVTLNRERKIFHHINKKSGLQNNTVLSLYGAANGAIWLGLDNGVTYADLNSPFATIFPDGDLQGTGYSVSIFDNNIYFGTNTGLFVIPWKKYYGPDEKHQFQKVLNSEGQVWSLNTLDDQLLMGHHEGAFEIKGREARKLTNQPGVWRFVKPAPGVAIAGHYGGLATFKKQQDHWQFDRVLEGFAESSRLLAQDAAGSIWMAHPYRGIYRMSVNAETGACSAEHFGEAEGLPSDLGNHLFKLGDQVVFTGKKGVFDFDPAKTHFTPNGKFQQLFGENTRVKYLNQDQFGNIWYVHDHETGLLQVVNGALEKKVNQVPIPELHNKLAEGFQFLLPVDSNNVFVATNQGFIHFNLATYRKTDSTIRLVLHEVRLKSHADSLLFGGHQRPGDEPIVLASEQNSLTISFSAPDYPGGEFVQYAHYLEGIEKRWSEWSAETDVALNHLRPGEYVFHIKARNQHGHESAPITFAFTISPPWYDSPLAYVFYALLGLGLVAGIIYRQQRQFERERKSLQSLHRQQAEQHELRVRRSEEAILQLQHEKLEAEVNHKTQELASVTMHLVQKNTMLSTIQEALSKVQGKAGAAPEVEKEIGRLIKMLEHDARVDEDWEHFSLNFDQVHSDFLKRLGEKHDHLSPNDYRLCAYLRMNLSTKEIASLMNISVRGVEASRYRLRRRLNLDTDVNLTEYLMRF